MNVIRADPKSILPQLEEMVPRFKGKILKRPGKIDLLTKEGVTVVKETIEYIKKVAKSSPKPLEWCQYLS